MFDVTLYALCKKFTKDWVASHSTLNKTIVEQLPPVAEADENTIYFVPVDPSDTTKGYDEYLVIDGQWELLTSATVEVDLDNIGFIVDENDDEMLIIDCKQHYSSLDTYEKFTKYIKDYFNYYTDLIDQRGALHTTFNWLNSRTDAEKQKCWLFLNKLDYRGPDPDAYTASIIYSTGVPYIDDSDGTKKVKCQLNGTEVSYTMDDIFWMGYAVSGGQQYGSWTDPITGATPYGPGSAIGYYNEKRGYDWDNWTQIALLHFPDIKIKE